MPHRLHPWRATKEVGRSFIFAFAGLTYTMNSQRNMRFHIFFAIFAIAFYVAFDVPRAERAIMLIAICLVPAFEIINTSIEAQMDYVAQDQHILLKRAKDTAAAAVLVMALLSMALGGYILLPGFIKHFGAENTGIVRGFGVVLRMIILERLRGADLIGLTVTGVRIALAFLVLGSLLTFWVLRPLLFVFKPLLALASLVGGLGTMALCICGGDPSAYVAMDFLYILEMNAFARLALQARIAKEWEHKNLPFDTAALRWIIPFTLLGNIIGGWLGWGPLAPICR